MDEESLKFDYSPHYHEFRASGYKMGDLTKADFERFYKMSTMSYSVDRTKSDLIQDIMNISLKIKKSYHRKYDDGFVYSAISEETVSASIKVFIDHTGYRFSYRNLMFPIVKLKNNGYWFILYFIDGNIQLFTYNSSHIKIVRFEDIRFNTTSISILDRTLVYQIEEMNFFYKNLYDSLNKILRFLD